MNRLFSLLATALLVAGLFGCEAVVVPTNQGPTGRPIVINQYPITGDIHWAYYAAKGSAIARSTQMFNKSFSFVKDPSGFQYSDGNPYTPPPTYWSQFTPISTEFTVLNYGLYTAFHTAENDDFGDGYVNSYFDIVPNSFSPNNQGGSGGLDGGNHCPVNDPCDGTGPGGGGDDDDITKLWLAPPLTEDDGPFFKVTGVGSKLSRSEARAIINSWPNHTKDAISEFLSDVYGKNYSFSTSSNRHNSYTAERPFALQEDARVSSNGDISYAELIDDVYAARISNFDAASLSETTFPAPQLYENELHVFPNPAFEYINVSLKGDILDRHVIIYDNAGRLIMSANQPSGTSRIDLNTNGASWDAGMYHIVIKDANGNPSNHSYTSTFIKL